MTPLQRQTAAWLAALPEVHPIPPPAEGGGTHVLPAPPGLLAVTRDGATCRVQCRFAPGEDVPPVPVGVTVVGSTELLVAARLDRHGRATLTAPPHLPLRLRVSPLVDDELDVDIRRKLGQRDERAMAQLRAATSNPLLTERVRCRAEFYPVEPMAEPVRDAVRLLDRLRWPLEDELEYARRLRPLEQVLEPLAGAGQDSDRDWREPFGVRVTAVRPTGETRWRLTHATDTDTPDDWKIRFISAGQVPEEGWSGVRVGRSEGRPGVEVVVDGAAVAALPAAGLAVLISPDGYYQRGWTDVVLLRAVEPPPGASAEQLAAAGLLVDAWRAKASAPLPELGLFLLLHVIPRQVQGWNGFDTDGISDEYVQGDWSDIGNISRELLDGAAALLNARPTETP